MLVHGAQSLLYDMGSSSTGFSTDVVDLSGEYPSPVQGYGRIQMKTSLNFGISSNNPLSMYIPAGGASPATDPSSTQGNYQAFAAVGTKSYSATVGLASAVRVTMSYTDYEASNGASAANVMKNILTVKVHNTRSGLVSSPLLAAGTKQSNMQVIDIPQSFIQNGDVLTISVTCSTLLVGPQAFALIISAETPSSIFPSIYIPNTRCHTLALPNSATLPSNGS